MKEIIEIAVIAHEVNRAYCQSIGDMSHPSWKDAPEWQRESAINGVHAHLGADLTPEQSHERWCADKERAGWRYGPVKDAGKLTHPCLVPYAQLPIEQRTKDYLFRAVVHACAGISITEPAQDPAAARTAAIESSAREVEAAHRAMVVAAQAEAAAKTVVANVERQREAADEHARAAEKDHRNARHRYEAALDRNLGIEPDHYRMVRLT